MPCFVRVIQSQLPIHLCAVVVLCFNRAIDGGPVYMHNTRIQISVFAYTLQLASSFCTHSSMCSCADIQYTTNECLNPLSLLTTAGEKFLESTSKMASEKTAPQLGVGGACISVAMEMGGVEGRYPEAMEVWSRREKQLQQSLEWQSFRQNIEQVGKVAC